MNQSNLHCHPLFFTTVYPILKRIPADCHQEIIRQSECGTPLTAEQAALFGLPLLCGDVLVPSNPAMPLTSDQLDRTYGADARAVFMRALTHLTQDDSVLPESA